MSKPILQPETMKNFAQTHVIKIMAALVLVLGAITLAFYVGDSENLQNSTKSDIFGGIQIPILCYGNPSVATLPNNNDPSQNKVSIQWNVSKAGALSYSWDFYDGASIASSTTKNPTVTYTTIGTKKASVYVNNGIDDHNTYNCSIKINPSLGINVDVLPKAPSLSLIFPPPTVYDPTSGITFSVGYGLTKGDGASVGITLKINGPLNNSPKVATVQQVQSADGSYTIQWDGKFNGTSAPDGSYTYSITANTAVGNTPLSAQPLQGNFTIKNNNGNNDGGGNPPTPPPTPTPTPTPPPLGNGNTGLGNGTNSGSGNNSGSGSGSNSGSNIVQDISLKPAEDLITCRIVRENLVLSNNQGVGVECYLRKDSYVSAMITDTSFNPKDTLDPNSVIKLFLNDKKRKIGPTSFYWDGIDDYDQMISPGEYYFVILARKDATYTPDYSIQKFTVVEELPPVEPVNPSTQQTEQIQPPPPSPTPTPPPVTPEPQTQEIIPPPPPQPSKCPGVNYPTDIAGHWAEAFIKQAYDRCAVHGFDDGTFHPDYPSTRFQAVKMGLAIIGIPPKVDCYSTDCGTPFTDLKQEEAPWIRAAWELGIVVGKDGRFHPDEALTRAEAAVLSAKLLGLKPHENCYTAECGAGYPNNLFVDVTEYWLGPYLRTLVDKGFVQGKAPFQFKPQDLVTRAEFLKIIMKARGFSS